jgi:hypothetical protein
MNSRHYLCSQLVSLNTSSGTGARDSVVNLEEIWDCGAILESEQAVDEGALIEIRCEQTFFSGKAVKVEKHEYGWRVEVKFSPMTPWKPDEFQPAHLFEVP